MNPFAIDPFELTLRILLALLLGGLIGFERERNNRPAGFRTHILVCVGSTLFMLISAYGFGEFADHPNVRLDPSRFAAQVISGIGFLGAGTILRTKMSVTGLTTAASLWVVSAIGLAVGAGFYYGAFLTTGLVLGSLYALNNVEKRFFADKRTYSIVVTAVNTPDLFTRVSTSLELKGITVQKMSIDEEKEEGLNRTRMSLSVKVPKRSLAPTLAADIRDMEGVIRVSMETI